MIVATLPYPFSHFHPGSILIFAIYDLAFPIIYNRRDS